MLRKSTDTYLQNLLENDRVYPPLKTNKQNKNKPKTHFSLTSLL